MSEPTNKGGIVLIDSISISDDKYGFCNLNARMLDKPLKIDIVSVTRCKDCKHNQSDNGIKCGRSKGDDWYCADGLKQERTK